MKGGNGRTCKTIFRGSATIGPVVSKQVRSMIKMYRRLTPGLQICISNYSNPAIGITCWRKESLRIEELELTRVRKEGEPSHGSARGL